MLNEVALKERRNRLVEKWNGKLQYWGQPASSAAHAFCFDMGWDEIVDRLLTDLFSLGWDGDVHQTKEKFGGLRVYIGTGSDVLWDRIDEAEDESLRTCEVCGELGKIRNGGWLKTLCDLHWR